MARLTDIRARMRELEREAARYARFPEKDEWPVGTVITYTWSDAQRSAAFGDTAFSCIYAVLKAHNLDWYWTGEGRGVSRGNYDLLVENLASDNVSNIHVALPGDFKPLFAEEVVGEEASAKVDNFLANPEAGVRVERPDMKGK